MPNISPNKAKGIIKLIQTQNKDYFCPVKTVKNAIHTVGGSSLTVPCRVNTGPMKAKSPVIFEPEIAGNLPDGLQIDSTLLLLKGGKSGKFPLLSQIAISQG